MAIGSAIVWDRYIHLPEAYDKMDIIELWVCDYATMVLFKDGKKIVLSHNNDKGRLSCQN